MSQSKRQSMIEVVTNIAIGYVVALISQIIIFPVFDIHITITDNLLIGAWFTVIAIVRGYLVRRYFNYKHGVKNG